MPVRVGVIGESGEINRKLLGPIVFKDKVRSDISKYFKSTNAYLKSTRINSICA